MMMINTEMSQSEDEEINMAAWILGVKNLSIQPYPLPSLSKLIFLSILKISSHLTFTLMISNEVIEAHEYCDDRQSSISGPHDVTIRIKAVGICGSDVHYYKTMRCANFIANKPKVLGHECAGIVQELGTQVQSLAVGDKVALEPGISCQTCNFCKGLAGDHLQIKDSIIDVELSEKSDESQLPCASVSTKPSGKENNVDMMSPSHPVGSISGAKNDYGIQKIDDNKMEKVKRAVATVKTKILENEKDDQIQELASTLIERQTVS
ncbi:hypothetical protein AHAS_Ahas05G0309000 [Arachis hypogaea]